MRSEKKGIDTSLKSSLWCVDGASQQPAEINLDWEDSVGATSYDIYFGTTNPPPFLINKTPSSHDPGTLNNGKIYYWQIISKNSGGNTAGAIWSFTTATVDTTLPRPRLDLKSLALLNEYGSRRLLEQEHHNLPGSL